MLKEPVILEASCSFQNAHWNAWLNKKNGEQLPSSNKSNAWGVSNCNVLVSLWVVVTDTVA